MTDARARLFALRQGALAGVRMSSLTCLLLCGIAACVFVVGGSFVDPAYRKIAVSLLTFLLIVLVASLLVGATMGAVGGAAIGLFCHEVLARDGSPAIASMGSTALGAATGFLGLHALQALWLAAGGQQLSAGLLVAFCLLTGFGGLMIGLGFVRDYA